MDYTVFGDRVNLAARLESANKFHSTHILVSEYSVADLKIDTLLRKVGLIRVAGKDEAVTVFEAIAYHNDFTFPDMAAALAVYGSGLASYQDGYCRWALHFMKTLNTSPLTGLRKSMPGAAKPLSLRRAPPIGMVSGS